MKGIIEYIYGTRKMSFMLLGTSQLLTLFSVIKDLYNDTFQFEEIFEIFVIFIFAGVIGSIWFITIEFLQGKRCKMILKKVEWNKIKEGNFILSDQYNIQGGLIMLRLRGNIMIKI